MDVSLIVIVLSIILFVLFIICIYREAVVLIGGEDEEKGPVIEYANGSGQEYLKSMLDKLQKEADDFATNSKDYKDLSAEYAEAEKKAETLKQDWNDCFAHASWAQNVVENLENKRAFIRSCLWSEWSDELEHDYEKVRHEIRDAIHEADVSWHEYNVAEKQANKACDNADRLKNEADMLKERLSKIAKRNLKKDLPDLIVFESGNGIKSPPLCNPGGHKSDGKYRIEEDETPMLSMDGTKKRGLISELVHGVFSKNGTWEYEVEFRYAYASPQRDNEFMLVGFTSIDAEDLMVIAIGYNPYTGKARTACRQRTAKEKLEASEHESQEPDDFGSQTKKRIEKGILNEIMEMEKKSKTEA